MNQRANIDEQDTIDPEEWDQCSLFNALGLDQNEQTLLIDAWINKAPNASLNNFAKALVIGGSKLSQQLD